MNIASAHLPTVTCWKNNKILISIVGNKTDRNGTQDIPGFLKEEVKMEKVKNTI